MATYVWTIGGSARSIIIENATMQQTVNGVDTLSFTVKSLAGTYRPAPNDTIVLTENGTAIFGGLIEEVVERGADGYGDKVSLLLDCNAKDYSLYAARRIVTETFAAGTLKSMLTTLVTNYLATYGVALHASQSNGPSLPEFPFTRRPGNNVLDDLAAAAGYIWKIDANKKLRMWAPGDITAAFDVIDGDGHAILDVHVDTIRNDAYANRIYALVSSGPATSTEDFVAADGVDDSTYTRFTAKYPAVSDINTVWPNELYINGIGQGPIMWGFPTGAFAWGWDYANHQLVYVDASGGAFPTGGDVVEITYVIAYPFTVQADDAAGQAAYGLWERVIERQDPLPLEAAQALVDGLILQQSPVLKRAVYQTGQLGPGVGETQTITLSKRDLNVSMLTQEITTTWPTGTVAFRQVTALESLVAQATYRDTYNQMLQTKTSSTVTGETARGPGAPDQAVQFNRGGVLWGDGGITSDGKALIIGTSYAPLPTNDGAALTITGGGEHLSGSENLVFVDIEPGLDVATTIPVGKVGIGTYMGPSMTTAASGTHPIIDTLHVDPPFLTSGGAAVGHAAAVYITGAPSIGADNWAIYIETDASFFGGFMQGQEITAPSAPPSNGFRLYAEDNGGGKTRLMVKFATGAAQQIAIEP